MANCMPLLSIFFSRFVCVFLEQLLAPTHPRRAGTHTHARKKQEIVAFVICLWSGHDDIYCLAGAATTPHCLLPW